MIRNTLNPTFVSLAALPAFLLASHGSRQDGATNRAHRAAATISCPAGDDSISAEDVCNVLGNNGFLASVFPGLTAGEPDSLQDSPSAIFCRSEQVAEELLSISVFAVKAESAKNALDAVLAAVPRLRPSRAADAERQLDAAKPRAKETEEKLVVIRDAMAKFVEVNGSIEPGVYLSSTREELVQQSQQLLQSRFDLAMQQSLRDSIEKQLGAMPAQVEVRRSVPSMKKQLVERQLNSIPSLDIQDTKDASTLLNMQLKMVDDLEKRMSSGEFEDKIIVDKDVNPHRQELENHFFDVERQLVDTKAREAALTSSVELLRSESIRFWKLGIQWDALQERFDMTRETALETAAVLSDAERTLREAQGRPTVRVVTGPQVD